MAAIATATPLLAQGDVTANTGRARAPVPDASPTPEARLVLDELTRRMTVPVSIADKGPFPFVVDTGAERSVVSRELAARLQLDPGPSARLFDFTGMSMVDTARVPSLAAGPLSARLIVAPLLAEANLGASGMLGIDALQGHKLVIDFDRNRMTVTAAKRHANGDILVQAPSRAGQLIVTTARFNGKPIAVVIDTGSWMSIGNFAMRRLAKKPPRVIGRVTVQSVTGRSFDADFVTVPKIEIGDIRFDRFGLSFADVAPFERFGLKNKPALILGMSSLRLFRRVEIDFVNREIAFTLPRPEIDVEAICRGGTAGCMTY